MNILFELKDWITSNEGIKELLGYVGTLFSVAIGAFLAYRSQNKIEQKKEEIRQISSCQQALFFLGVLQENLHDLKKELEPNRKNEVIGKELPHIVSCGTALSYNTEPLTFLLHSKEPNIVYLLAMMEREFNKLVSIINIWNIAHSNNDIKQLAHFTEQLYDQYERCHIFNGQVMKKSLSTFKSEFKSTKFVVGVTNVMNH